MFDSIVNDEVRYPRFLSNEAIALMRRVSVFRCVFLLSVLAKSVLCKKIFMRRSIAEEHPEEPRRLSTQNKNLIFLIKFSKLSKT